MTERTTLTRRGVLGGAAVVSATAASGALGATTVAGATPAAPGPRLPRLRMADFRKLIGTALGLLVGSQRTTITLESVTALTMTGLPRHTKVGSVKTTGEQFSLIFGEPASGRVDQGVYQLSASGLPTFSLLLVPIGPAGGQDYQAIIVSV